MQQIILVFHVLICLALIGLVLIQHGKGADAGAAFGSGASQTVFGSRGAGTFLLKITSGFAALFFFTSLALNYLASHAAKEASEIAVLPTTATKSEVPINEMPTNAIPATLPMSTGVPTASLPVTPTELPASDLSLNKKEQQSKGE